MFYTVYQITNLLDDKIYIGKHQTKRLDDGYMGSGKILLRAIKKHGLENFKKEILFVFSTEAEMNAKEAELVNEDFVGRTDTYNLCFGGQGGFGYINSNPDVFNGFGQRPETQKKYSLLGNRRLAELRQDAVFAETLSITLSEAGKKAHASGRNEAFRGKRHSAESKEKMRAANKQKGSQNSQFGTMWITNGVESRKIKKDLDNIPEGWYKGRNTR